MKFLKYIYILHCLKTQWSITADGKVEKKNLVSQIKQWENEKEKEVLRGMKMEGDQSGRNGREAV